MRKLQYVFMALAALCFAVPAFADSGSAVINLTPIGVGLAMGLAAAGCGIGEGKTVSAAIEAYARNPMLRSNIQTLMFIGLAFIESLALFALMMCFVKM